MQPKVRMCKFFIRVEENNFPQKIILFEFVKNLEMEIM